MRSISFVVPEDGRDYMVLPRDSYRLLEDRFHEIHQLEGALREIRGLSHALPEELGELVRRIVAAGLGD